MPKSIPLVDAALRIGRSYNATMRLVLLGQLAGSRNDRGQWIVEQKSVEQFLKAQASAQEVKGPQLAASGA